MKELIHRLTSPTPAFFVKVRTIGLSLVGVGTFLLTGGGVVAATDAMKHYGEHLFIIGSVISILAQTTKKDPA